MAHRSDPRFLVLHGLRVKGVADATAASRATGLGVEEVEHRLADLAEDGWVEHRDGGLKGWRLTPAGIRAHAGLVAAELDASRARPAVAEAHRRFLEINPELLATCTAWQLRQVDSGVVANDHTDEVYDRSVVSRLAAVHHRALPLLEELSAGLGRFSRYGERLQAALDRVVAGEGEWFTRPLRDSYHSVWFELHQDLLETLGLDRAAEAVTA